MGPQRAASAGPLRFCSFAKHWPLSTGPPLAALTFLKICIQHIYNVLCTSDVLKCIFPILQIIFQWGKTLSIFLFPFALRLFTMADTFTCFMSNALKRKIPQETRLNIDIFFTYSLTFLDICT